LVKSMEIPHFQVPKPKDLSSLLGGLALVMGTSTVVCSRFS